MADDKEIPQLDELLVADAIDLLVIEDISEDTTKRITKENLFGTPGHIGNDTPGQGTFTALNLPVGSINEFSPDGTLGGNSNAVVPTEQAVKTYVDNVSFLVTQSTISGVENIAEDSSSISIVFIVDQTSNDYAVVASIENSVDLNPSIYAHIITRKSVDGFSVLLSGAVDSGNYYLNWMADNRLTRGGSLSSSSSSSSSRSSSSSSSSSSSRSSSSSSSSSSSRSSSSSSSSSSYSSSSSSSSSSSRSSSSSSSSSSSRSSSSSSSYSSSSSSSNSSSSSSSTGPDSLPDWLSGFPVDSTSYMEVVMGTAWDPGAPWSEDEVIRLYKVPYQPIWMIIWTEDGTLTENVATNRLKFTLINSGTTFSLILNGVFTGAISFQGIFTHSGPNIFGSVYTIGDVLNATPGISVNIASPFVDTTAVFPYKNGVFKSITFFDGPYSSSSSSSNSSSSSSFSATP